MCPPVCPALRLFHTHALAAPPTLVLREPVRGQTRRARVQLALALVRGGMVVTFLADPVVSGFTTGSAMLIVASQLKHLMGVTYDANGFVMTMVHAAAAVPRINPFTLSIGMAAIGAMHGLKEANKKFLPHTLVPEQLAVVIVFTVLAWALHLGDAPFRVALVGHVDTSLPTVRLPPFCLLTLSLSFPGPGVGVT